MSPIGAHGHNNTYILGIDMIIMNCDNLLYSPLRSPSTVVTSY